MLARILGSPLLLRVQRADYFSFTIRGRFQRSVPVYEGNMARLTGRALKEDMANTVIEDSEPERAAEEAMLKEQRKRRRAEAKMLKEQAKQPQRSLTDEVIVISDSELNIAHSSRPSVQPIAQSVIEISVAEDTANQFDKSTSPPQPVLYARADLIPSLSSDKGLENIGHPSLHTIQHDPHQGALNDEPNLPMNLAECITSTAYPDSPTAKLDLSRFAFAGRPGPSIKRTLDHVKPTPPSTHAAPRIPKTAALDLPFTDIFTTSQLTALSKCVVCDLAWTTRKTVPVKVLHMKRCAKKNLWKEDAVISAMTDEISRAPVPAAKERKNKGKGRAVSEDEAPKTYLEDVVNEAAPKKRRKKIKDADVVTVLNPQDAHAAILARSDALFRRGLQPSSSEFPHKDSVAFPSTQQFRPSKLGTSGGLDARVGVLGTGMLEDETSPVSGEQHEELELGKEIFPPPTQAFRPSALGGTLAKRSVFVHEDNDIDEVLENEQAPPPTQAFGKSGLAERFGKTKRPVVENNVSHSADQLEDSAVSPQLQHAHRPNADQMQARPYNHITSSPNGLLTSPYLRDPGAPSTSYSANEEHLYLPTTARTKLADLERRLAGLRTSSENGQRRQAVEDPYPIPPSVFEKLARARIQVEQDETDDEARKARDSSSSPSRASSKSRSRSGSRSRKPRKPRRRKSRSRPQNQETMDGGSNGNQYDSPTLVEDMRRIIMEDKELYMRILRYEPIHFDVFLKAASQHGMDGRGFGFKLRAFLDRQAINFYGDTTLATGRRRYK